MAVPSINYFINILKTFESKPGFLHCLEAIDRKHVSIKKIQNSESLYYNFKSYYSIVLQAVVNANYSYICMDGEDYCCQHDSATFKASKLYKALMMF